MAFDTNEIKCDGNLGADATYLAPKEGKGAMLAFPLYTATFGGYKSGEDGKRKAVADTIKRDVRIYGPFAEAMHKSGKLVKGARVKCELSERVGKQKLQLVNPETGACWEHREHYFVVRDIEVVDRKPKAAKQAQPKAAQAEADAEAELGF